MLEYIVGILAKFPPELATFLIAMIPIGELRAALPIALLKFNLPMGSALFFSVAGNLAPMFLVIYLLKYVEKSARRFPIGARFLDWLFARTHRKFVKDYEKYGAAALALFVAIPLPMTGAWTGSIAAWLFGIPKTYAFSAITAGVIAAAAIVAFATLGGLSLFSVL